MSQEISVDYFIVITKTSRMVSTINIQFSFQIFKYSNTNELLYRVYISRVIPIHSSCLYYIYPITSPSETMYVITH